MVLETGRRTAVGFSLGVVELVPREENPERARELFFSALRSGIEAIARRRPMIAARVSATSPCSESAPWWSTAGASFA